jgi:hypothetical protein
MVSSHVMEHDMQSSTACRMSLLIESVCRIASLLLIHPPRIGAWPPLGVPVRRRAHNRVWRPIGARQPTDHYRRRITVLPALDSHSASSSVQPIPARRQRALRTAALTILAAVADGLRCSFWLMMLRSHSGNTEGVLGIWLWLPV